MNHKILHGIIDGKHFVITIFDDQEIIAPMEAGLERFFEKCESTKLGEKRKKEADQGYLTLSGNS